jgi:terminase small subunit-like protein
MHDTEREETPKGAAYRPKKPTLRPVNYTQEIGSTICDRLFDGETLSEICRDRAMPNKPAVTRWLARYPMFRAEYQFTRQLLLEDLATEALRIVDAETGSLKQVRAALARLKRKARS